jgi:hypothetical protein
LNPEGDDQALEKVLLALFRSTRDTEWGMVQGGSTIGVIFTELGVEWTGER